MTTQDPQRKDARGLARALRETSVFPTSNQRDTAAGRPPANRRMLWVDAVGGFLICLDDEILLGQPSGAVGPEVPVLADISRRHALIRREQGSYVLDPIAPTKIDGRAVTDVTLLSRDCLIELGESVKFRFTQPHALSATARLTIESGHRTVPSCDSVLLMAESCVLGPGRHSHVRCRDWSGDVILFRSGQDLACRGAAPLSVDGKLKEGAQRLGDGSRIEGQDFSIGIEVV